LAISRADETEIRFDRWNDGSVQFAPRGRSGYEITANDRRFVLPAGTLPALESSVWTDARYATIPIIPPRFRPKYDLKGYHLLWEAVWHRTKTARAPRDPALLKRIGGDLFAVLAIWDLTPLEMAVLEMRPQ